MRRDEQAGGQCMRGRLHITSVSKLKTRSSCWIGFVVVTREPWDCWAESMPGFFFTLPRNYAGNGAIKLGATAPFDGLISIRAFGSAQLRMRDQMGILSLYTEGMQFQREGAMPYGHYSISL